MCQRRLEDKSKIPATVGQEHVQLGRWLTGNVVGIVLLALANGVFGSIAQNDIWGKELFTVVFIGLMFGAAIAALALLYKAQPKLW